MTKKILLVEYDEATIHTIKGLFQPPVFDLVIASDGETAKQLLQNKSFDLMITAAMLPRFHGFNLALQVSQDHPGMKIIIISAIYKGLEYRHQATTQYRASDFFEKPLDKEKFKKRVLELLNISSEELAVKSPAAATKVPMFDTAKIPALNLNDSEENKLSSADIFGDIINKIETLPEFEIDLGDGSRQAARKPAAPRPEPPRPAPPPSAPAPAPRPDPGRTVIARTVAPPAKAAAPAFDFESLKGPRKPTPQAGAPSGTQRAVDQKIGASLDGLRTQQVKREVPKDQMRKIEDDIARKFEDTLSGLGLGTQPKPAASARPAAPPPVPPRPVPVPEIKASPKPVVQVPPPPRPEPQTTVMPEIKIAAIPEAPPVPPAAAAPAAPPPARDDKVLVKEVQETFADQVIDLGIAAALPETQQPMAPPPIPPLPIPAPQVVAPEARELRPEKKAADEVAETRVEKKPVVADNPNEVGDYALLGLIARGGMAEIYKAKKKGVKGFEKVIAIKKILSGYGEDDKYIEMLVDEAKIAAELTHPNIVQIYDLGRKDNYYFIAMEYVLGKDLREIQTRLRERDKWFPEEISIFLTLKILEALNYAHKAKDSRGRSLDIVHRDVSPPNILISYNGDVKLTDFGVSKASIKIHQTLSGALKGKLLYMSPEQACGDSTIDYRSDLYSVGVLLFELITGRKLFLDTSEMTVLKKVQNGEIINPRDIQPDIDPALEKILLTSLNKECDKRYQSAAAMIADLEAYIHKKYDRAPGPVHLAHFLYGLFESEIQREAIKVDLKPLPYTPKMRESAKPQPPPEKPKPAAPPRYDGAAPPPAPVAPAAPPAPPPPMAAAHAAGVSINLEEEKPAKPLKKTGEAEKTAFNPDALFRELDKEKKKFPLLPVAAVLLVAVAAGLYFLVFRKPSSPGPGAASGQVQTVSPADAQTEAQKAEMKRIADKLAATQKALDEAKLKQEEELKIQAEEEKKKLLDERRKKADEDRVKREEEAARLKKEEEDKRALEEANQRQAQEEQARLQKAEEDRKKAEEQKLAELKKVKEGDIVPLGEVDVQPQPISNPPPSLPASIRSTMPASVTVMFTILINHNGDVESVRLLQKSNNTQLNTILTDLVKTWKYQPASKDGKRVKVWKTVPLSIKK